MNKWKRMIFLITAALMIFCFLLSSTDLIIKEEIEEVKKISVYIDSNESSYLRDLKNGILEIANENRVDVNYITSQADVEENVSEQIAREYEGGSQAVIMVTENLGTVQRYFQENKEEDSVITVNAWEYGSEYLPDITFDVAKAAEELSEAVRQKYGKDKKTILLVRDDQISEKIGQKIKEVFTEKEMYAVCMESEQKNVWKYKMGQEKLIYIGCWISETEWAVEHLDGCILYGVGYSNKILSKIMEGKIEGVAAFSMYEIGIHAIQQAIAVIEQEETGNIQVSCRMITKENIKEQEEYLIPIH